MKSDHKMAVLMIAILVIAALGLVTPVNAQLWQWQQVSEEGFGDLTNDYAWGMANYTVNGTSYLYVGTLNTDFSGTSSTRGCEVWRTNGTEVADGKYLWEQVVGPTGSQATAGFYNVPGGSGSFRNAFGTRGMAIHAGLLWAGTMSRAEIFVTNGTAWKRANLPWFNTTTASSTRGITVYNGSIYAEAMDQANGARIYRYDGPTDFASIGTNENRSKWTQVNYNGFDGTNYNIGVGELIPFNPPDDGLDIEYLYAGTWTVESNDIFNLSMHRPFEIWRTNGTTNESDGTLYWEQVVGRANPYGNPPGFGDAYNANVMSVAIFDGALYVGTLNFIDGAEIWRTRNGTTWECVAPYGFAHLNLYMWRLIAYQNKIIAGTMNPLFGCELWASDTGNLGTWKQINLNGMDLTYTIPLNVGRLFNNTNFIVPIADQYGVRTVGIYDDYLIVGTASWGDWVDMALDDMFGDPHGTHNYSENVGCEVWRSNGTEYTLPTINVTKTVWNGTAWVHDLATHVGTVVRFNITIANNDRVNVTNITIADILSCSLEYADDATLILSDGVTQKREPDCNFSLSPYNLSMLKWHLSGLDIEPGQALTIEYDAYVVKSGIDANILVSFGHPEEESKCCECGWDYVLICSQPAPSGDATDSGGAVKDVYTTGETVYATGSGFTPNSQVDIYIVDDYKWIGGEDINNFHVYKSKLNVPTDTNGTIVPTAIWPNPIPGEYDMFFDANQNGINDLEFDVLDNPHDPGLTVIGEAPALTPLGLLALVGLLGIIAIRTMVRKKRG
jgi:uncharacterized repeat protein (TIGR01451 family)